jgi:MraZ protein
MLMGEYHHTIDDKGRLIIPAKFRDDLGDTFVITRGLDNCLFVFSSSEWNKFTKNLNTLPFTRKNARNFSRFLLSGATVTEFDRQGRINITSPLISYADLKKECVIIGVGDRLEIWASEKWNYFYESNKDAMSEIAEDLFDSNWTEGE